MIRMFSLNPQFPLLLPINNKLNGSTWSFIMALGSVRLLLLFLSRSLYRPPRSFTIREIPEVDNKIKIK